jgi:O-antigen/teichoic acid export membrane protein
VNLRKVLAFGFGPIGAAAVGLATVPMMTWYFNQKDIGRLAMLQVGINFCLLFFSFGLDQAYVREYHEDPRKRALFRASLAPGGLILIVLLGVLLFKHGLLSQWLFKVDDARVAGLAVICIVGSFFGRFFSLVLRMQERAAAFSMSLFLPKLGVLAVLLGFVVATTRHDFVQLIAAQAVALAGVGLFYGWNTRAEWTRPEAGQGLEAWLPSFERLQGLFSFGAPLAFSGMAFWAITSFDRIFLRTYSTFDQLGIYYVANSFAAVAVVLQNIFTTVWAPIAYRWHAQGVDPAQVHKIVDQVSAIAAIVFAAAGLLSWVITLLLPARFYEVRYVVVACLGYPVLYTLSEASSIGLGISRKSMHALAASVIALGVNVVANYELVPAFGASGAASATALSFLALFIARTEFACRLWSPRPRGRLYLTMAASVMMAVAYALAGARYGGYFLVLWSVFLLLGIRIFRREFAEMLAAIRSRLRGSSAMAR